MRKPALSGRDRAEPLGRYFYEKRRRIGRSVPAEVHLFRMHVAEEQDDWPEKGQRERRWFARRRPPRPCTKTSSPELIRRAGEPVTKVKQIRAARAREPRLSGGRDAEPVPPIMPKEESFFDMFERHAATLVGGAEVMSRMFAKEEGIEEACRQISKFEHNADDVTREVLSAVRRTFITPFDRSAITDLISSMDDSIDEMQKTAKAITHFEVEHFEPQMRDMAALAEQGAKLVAEAMPLMRNIGSNQRLHKITEQIVHLEEEADHLHEAGLKALFLGTATAMRWTLSSAAKSIATWRGSSTGSRTSQTRFPALSSTTPEERRHMHQLALPLLIGLIAIALAFDFLNGLHDAANSIATVVSTRLLSPDQAVVFAAFFNFAAFPLPRRAEPPQSPRRSARAWSTRI